MDGTILLRIANNTFEEREGGGVEDGHPHQFRIGTFLFYVEIRILHTAQDEMRQTLLMLEFLPLLLLPCKTCGRGEYPISHANIQRDDGDNFSCLNSLPCTFLLRWVEGAAEGHSAESI